MENKKIEKIDATEIKTEEVTEVKPSGFVKYSYSSEEAFARRETIKKADERIGRVVAETGGNMPKELVDAYEGLHRIMDHIKSVELEVIRVGR